MRPDYKYGLEDHKILIFKVILSVKIFSLKSIKLGAQLLLVNLFFVSFEKNTFLYKKMCPKLNAKFIIRRRSAKDFLN
jgi:hypothetical protein